MPTDKPTSVPREFNRLRGKLAGFIEACGLPERQERAIISTMKDLSYDAEAAINNFIEGNASAE